MNLDSVCGDAEKRSSVFLEPFEPELLLTKNPLRLVLTKAPQTFPFFAHNTNHRLLLIITMIAIAKCTKYPGKSSLQRTQFTASGLVWIMKSKF